MNALFRCPFCDSTRTHDLGPIRIDSGDVVFAVECLVCGNRYGADDDGREIEGVQVGETLIASLLPASS